MLASQHLRRPLTADEFQSIAAVHYQDMKTELYDGMIVVHEPEAFQSADVGATILILLGSYVRNHRLGRVLGEGGSYIMKRGPDTVYVPDVSFIANERVPYASARRKFVDGAPDLAVEVMSPSDRFSVIRRKADFYIATGTQIVWIVRPDERDIIVRHAGSDVVAILTEDDILDGEHIVPGFSCRVAEVFS